MERILDSFICNKRFFTVFRPGGPVWHEQAIELAPTATGAAGLALLKGKLMDLVIVDEQLDDMSGIEFVKQLVKVNPLVNTTIVSSLADEEFHEATEGLGVLMQLPPHPGENGCRGPAGRAGQDQSSAATRHTKGHVMMISVASGKGGTGKTTVATNMAMSLGRRVELLDCDVEEPNAHLFLQPVITRTERVEVPIPLVDEQMHLLPQMFRPLCRFNAPWRWSAKKCSFSRSSATAAAAACGLSEGAITETGRRTGNAQFWRTQWHPLHQRATAGWRGHVATADQTGAGGGGPGTASPSSMPRRAPPVRLLPP